MSKTKTKKEPRPVVNHYFCLLCPSDETQFQCPRSEEGRQAILEHLTTHGYALEQAREAKQGGSAAFMDGGDFYKNTYQYEIGGTPVIGVESSGPRGHGGPIR